MPMKFDTRFFELGFSYGWRDAYQAPTHGTGAYGSWNEFKGVTKSESFGGADFHFFYRGYNTGMRVAGTPVVLRALRYTWLIFAERVLA